MASSSNEHRDAARAAFSAGRGRIDLSRRGFLAGMGALAGAAGLGALAGCSPAAPASPAGDAPSANAAAPTAANASTASGTAAAATGNEGKTMGQVLGAGWLGEEPEIAADQISETQEADIIVCGAGHAGTACARRAAELGAKVIVVEVQPEDTFSALGNDIGHLNSEWQLKRVGIPE